MKQHTLSRVLRFVVIVGWCACVLLAYPMGPMLAREAAEINPELAYLRWPCLVVLWLGLAVVAAALCFAWRIFGEIGRDNSFCRENALRLRIIGILALADTLLCVLSMVVLIALNAMHPSVFLMMLLIAVIGVGAASAAGALSHLTLKAADIQAENDLTV